jgi:hypothetical protein
MLKLQTADGPDAEIRIIPGQVHSARAEETFMITVQGQYFQYIVQCQRVEKGFNIMESVMPFTDNPQSKVDLSTGETQHSGLLTILEMSEPASGPECLMVKGTY